MGLLQKDKIPEFLEQSKETEFEVLTVSELKERETNILNNAVATEVDKKIGDRISELHTQYDKDIEEVTGLKKEPNQKTYEFNKQVLSQYKKDQEGYTDLKQKYTDLEKTKSKGNEDTIKELEEVRKQAKADKEASELKITELTNTSSSQQKGFIIDGTIAGLKFNENIPEAVRKSFIEKERQSLINGSEMREGKLVFLKEDGHPVLNKDHAIKDASEMVNERLSEILVKGKPGLNLKKDKKEFQSIVLPDHVKDKNGVIAYMKTIPGLNMNTKEWTETFRELSKNLKNL